MYIGKIKDKRSACPPTPTKKSMIKTKFTRKTKTQPKIVINKQYNFNSFDVLKLVYLLDELLLYETATHLSNYRKENENEIKTNCEKE